MEGVLLFYKYVVIRNLEEVSERMRELCSSLFLKGRVRISPEGINVTVGGKMAALQAYMNELESHPLFQGCDFKLGECHGPMAPALSTECGFDSLSVRIVKEVVTLGPFARDVDKHPTGIHVSPHDFHKLLLSAKGPPAEADHMQGGPETHCESGCGGPDELTTCDSDGHKKADERKGMVVIDARNLYETRVGRFTPPPGVEWLDPRVRQFSDLPRWLDDIAPAIEGKRILMYCTGGVRCERASAYLRGKGDGFQDVFQLSGGIHRYLESFPDGGFFVGKNFVFDPRVSVWSGNAEVVGRCVSCGTCCDDYSARCRCRICRMLIILCQHCNAHDSTSCSGITLYICELCDDSSRAQSCHLSRAREADSCQEPVKRCMGYCEDSKAVVDAECGQATTTCVTQMEAGNVKDKGEARSGDGCETKGGSRKLRILCLHGFRQSASSLQGRTAALRKRLRHVAELIYIDGPHLIANSPSTSASATDATRIPGLNSTQQSAHDRARAAPSVKSTHSSSTATVQGGSREGVKPRYAWLVEPTDGNENANAGDAGVGMYDAEQYRRQTEGWDMSCAYLSRVVRERGPFDGIMGFSQGAAVAATFCALAQNHQQHRLREIANPKANADGSTAGIEEASDKCASLSNSPFRFAILASGFVPATKEHVRLWSGAHVALPSLHIFGAIPNQDRQIGVTESEKLMGNFDSCSRHVVSHDFGHIIPSNSLYIQKYVQFLTQFMA